MHASSKENAKFVDMAKGLIATPTTIIDLVGSMNSKAMDLI